MLKTALVAACCLLILANAAASKPMARKLSCHRTTFEGDIAAGHSFVREVGEGLSLRLEPQNFGDEMEVLSGWRIVLTPTLQKRSTQGANDFIYPVNPPLRFNATQDIGTSYGISAERKLQHAVTYAFVLNTEDYRKIETVLNDALWPYTAHDPQAADERYLSALASLTLGELRFVPLQVVTDRGGRGIQRLRFRVEIVAPNSFKFSRAFSNLPSPCPSRRQ